MNCPSCRSRMRVWDTRESSASQDQAVERELRCACGERWLSVETLMKRLEGTGPRSVPNPQGTGTPPVPGPPPFGTPPVPRGVGGGLSGDLFRSLSGSLSDPPADPLQRVDRAREVLGEPKYSPVFEVIWAETGRRGLKAKAAKAWKIVGCPSWDAIRAPWAAYLLSERPVAGYVQDLSTWLRGRGHQQEWVPAGARRPPVHQKTAANMDVLRNYEFGKGQIG